jgi:hypothetical protein
MTDWLPHTDRLVNHLVAIEAPTCDTVAPWTPRDPGCLRTICVATG